MAEEKRAMYVVFKMDKKMSTEEWRKRFAGSYDIFKNMPGVFSKCWWCNQEKGLWGAFYIFNSEEELQKYITSDLWVNKVPEKYNAKPEITILEPGPILCKKVVTEAGDSWIPK
jgi:hypothetical protein